MKTWKNRNRRSKKRKQRGGVRLTPEQKIEYTKIRDEVNRKLVRIPPEDKSTSAAYLKSTISLINQFLKPMFDAKTGLIKDDSNTLGDIDARYQVFKTQEQVYNTEHGIAPAPAPAAAPVLPPAPAPAPPAGQAVYPMNAPAAVEGQPRTIADCNRMLDEARARIAELEGRLGVEAGRLEGVTKEREAEVARLGADIGAKEAEVEAATRAIEALRGEKDSIQTELGRIQANLTGTSELNRVLTDANTALTAAGENKDDRIRALEPLRGQLDTLTLANQATIRQHAAEIARIREEHRAELADISQRYREDAATLRANLARLKGEKEGTVAENRRVEEQKAGLEAQIAAFEARIAGLTGELAASETARGREAAAAAEAARQAQAAAAAEAAKLDAATAQGADLRARLAAAERAREAADGAAAEAVAARGAAEAAKRAADGRVAAAQEEADRARLAAEAALADRGASDVERNGARRAAEAADAARAQAVRDAAARAEEAAAARAREAAATGQRNVIQARLDVLEASVPTIGSIMAADGQVVGGAAGRPAVYGEPLTVTWAKGAEERTTWVFVMFADNPAGGPEKVPVYSQLVLNDQPFTFTSTVSGRVQAVVYDVVSHSRGNGAGQINF